MWTTINFLQLFSLNLPMKWADLSEKATLHCAFSMRNGVKKQYVKLSILTINITLFMKAPRFPTKIQVCLLKQ